jgi:hypothetical protein
VCLEVVVAFWKKSPLTNQVLAQFEPIRGLRCVTDRIGTARSDENNGSGLFKKRSRSNSGETKYRGAMCTSHASHVWRLSWSYSVTH